MSARDPRAYLFDVAQACELLTEFTRGKTVDDYLADAMLRSAVERQFEIVGEALRRALEADPGVEARIRDTGRIVAFRNRLAHGYATVSNEVVWGIVEGDLPRLRRDVQAFLDQYRP